MHTEAPPCHSLLSMLAEDQEGFEPFRFESGKAPSSLLNKWRADRIDHTNRVQGRRNPSRHLGVWFVRDEPLAAAGQGFACDSPHTRDVQVHRHGDREGVGSEPADAPVQAELKECRNSDHPSS